jgi:HEAT repeat protein
MPDKPFGSKRTQSEASPRKITELINVLQQDRDGMKRTEAIKALGQIDDDRAREAVILALQDDYLWAFEAAADALAQRGDERAVQVLITAMYEQIKRDQMYSPGMAAIALAEIGNPVAISPLIQALASEKPWHREDIEKALSRFGSAAVDPLINAIHNESSSIGEGAVNALSAIGSSAFERLLQTFTDGPTLSRRGVAKALGNIHDDRAVAPLIEALSSDDADLVAAASEALGKITDKRAAEPLIGVSHHPNSHVRAVVADALGSLNDPRATQPLIALLDDSNIDVCWHAQESLVKLGEPTIGPLMPKLYDEKEQVRRHAGEVLARIGGVAVNSLTDALHDPDWRVRTSAAVSLRLHYDEAVVDSLLSALRDDNFKVREAVATALGQIYNYAGFRVRRGEINTDAVSNALFALLEKKYEPARQVAADALVRLEGAGLTATIARGIEHPNPHVRFAIVTAIDRYFAHLDFTQWGTSFPSWFGVTKDFFHVMVSDSSREIMGRLVKRTTDTDNHVRVASLRALETIRAKLQEKRNKGHLDIHYSWNGPLPESELDSELIEEKQAVEAIKEAAAQAPPARYADFTFYHDGPNLSGVPDGYCLQVRQWYRLEVAVRVRPIGISPEAALREPIRELAQQRDVTIMAAAEGDGIEIAEPVQTLILPPSGDSKQPAYFRVQPLRKTASSNDLAKIRVRLYYEFNLLEVAIVSAEVVGEFDDPAHSLLELDRPLSFKQERLEREYLDFDNIHPRTMHVDITRWGDHFQLNFAFYNAAAKKVVFSAPARLSAADLEDDLINVRKTWYDIALSKTFSEQVDGNKEEFVSNMRRLADAGRRLWIKIFKRERTSALYHVGQWLERHSLEPNATVQVSSNADAANFVLPWSLLYDRPLPPKSYELPDLQGFWGVRYCIEQGLPNATRSSDTPLETGKQLKLGFMLWEQFRNADQGKAYLEGLQTRSAGRLDVSLPPITDADKCFGLLAECDSHLLYFYTHGYTRHRQADIGVGPNLELFVRRYERLASDSPVRETYGLLYEAVKQKQFEPDRSWIELTYGRIYLDELYDRIAFLNTGPVVFLNMCESVQITPSLSDSFVHFFLDRGACTVIGTECPMTVEFARPFAESFITGVLEGQPVGKALLAARRQFLERLNPLGLAYTLYGSAMVRVEPPVLQSRTLSES